jgi:hypothetical protein
MTFNGSFEEACAQPTPNHPQGTWGMAVADVVDVNDVQSMTADDPAIRSGPRFSHEVYLVLRAIARNPC